MFNQILPLRLKQGKSILRRNSSKFLGVLAAFGALLALGLLPAFHGLVTFAEADGRTSDLQVSSSDPIVLPQTVLWQMVFTFANRATVEAERSSGASEESVGLWRDYFVRQGKITAANDELLKEFAAQYADEITPLDSKARSFIEQARSTPNGAEPIRPTEADPTNELQILQERRNEITLHYRDLFSEGIGEEAFHNFSTFLTAEFSKGAKELKIPGQKADNAASPQAFIGITWILWDDNLPVPVITGLAGTYFDYSTGYFYDPWIGSVLYNYTTSTGLHTGDDKGFAWLYPALTFHPVYPSVRGNRYCVYSEHWAIDRVIFKSENSGSGPGNRPGSLENSINAPESSYYLGYTEPCHTVPPSEQCEEALAGGACADPSPTPTPSPTPIEVKTVSFSGDFQILKFAQYNDDTRTAPPIQDPTWTRGGSTNAENVVAYTKGTETMKMKLSASFDVNPAPPTGDPLNVKVRVKYDGRVIAAMSNNMSVTQSSFSIPDLQVTDGIQCANQAPQCTPRATKSTPTFAWEVSVDDGQTWRAAGNSQHVIYWTFADPINPANCGYSPAHPSGDGILRNCTFVNGSSSRLTEFLEFEGLYDKALEKAFESLSEPTPQTPQNKESIAKDIAKLIDSQVNYSFLNTPNLFHPLRIFADYHYAQCSANTSLMQGLLRSIGIDSQQIFVWGGKPTSAGQPQGGKIYVYNYRPKPGAIPDSYGEKKTFQIKRPAGENVEKNPHFAFHTMIELDGKYYDPSYGFDLYNQQNQPNSQDNYPFSNVFLEETANLDNPNNPRPFRLGSNATQPFTVKDLDLVNWCVDEPACSAGAVRVPTNQFCSHSLKIGKGQVRADFSGDGKDDFTVFRPSEGKWYVKKSSDLSSYSIHWGENGDKITPADYDGDGITDASVFRPSTGLWYTIFSSDNTIHSATFGIAGDKPVFGDFDGDGKSDIAVFRASNSNWYRLHSGDSSFNVTAFGEAGDVPIGGDYDGDGKTDIAVFRPSNGTWYFLTTSGSYYSREFGIADDVPLAGDFDNDDKTDLVVFRPSNSTWYIQGIDSYTTLTFGEAGDVPSVGSFDGDGIPDPTVWSPSTGRWRILLSESNTLLENYWGENGDIPVLAAYNR